MQLLMTLLATPFHAVSVNTPETCNSSCVSGQRFGSSEWRKITPEFLLVQLQSLRNHPVDCERPALLYGSRRRSIHEATRFPLGNSSTDQPRQRILTHPWLRGKRKT